MSAVQQMTVGVGGVQNFPDRTFLSRIVSIPVFTVNSISPYDFLSRIVSIPVFTVNSISPYDFNSVTAANVTITMAN